jgi:hypothetical protein
MKIDRDLIMKILPKYRTFTVAFFGIIIFEFLVAFPIYNYVSKQLGLILLCAIVVSFIAFDIYVVYRVTKYAIRNK